MEIKRSNFYLCGVILSFLYLFFSKYIDSILYPSYVGSMMYLPIIIIGFYFLSSKVYIKEIKIVDYFFKFILSLVFFYIPSLLLFTVINLNLSKENQVKRKEVKLTKIVSNRVKNAKIIIEMENKTYFIYGYSPTYEKYKTTPTKKLQSFLYYKEGLFGTKIVQKAIIYEK